MKFTNTEKSRGELAIRRMGEKAQTVYSETDPVTVAEYSNGEETLYFVDIAGNSCGGLTFEEAEQFLEDNYFEEEDEDQQ